ncbi:MAG: serine/threonine protein kinase [Pirellulaceae bacterium]|nr:serine/threonine protein kinase [Pirellulaceae bacterium]
MSENHLSEEELASWVEKLTTQYRESPHFNLEKELHSIPPEFHAEIVELWGAVMLSEAVALSVKEQPPEETTTLPHTTNTTSLPLPYDLADYTLLEEIGRGGMGVVYKAHQHSLKRTVAVKMILAGKLATEKERARFLKEATANANLSHPAIVPVYEVSEDKGHLFFSMQYVEGETLAHKLATGPLSPHQSVQLLLQLSDAVEYAHKQGIIHRDLKPSNIIISSSGKPLITDFGLAKFFTQSASLTREGAIIGTPTYMAPEQAAGLKDADNPPCDIYSLGTIMYHMLCGSPPLQAENPIDLVRMVIEQDPLPPRKLNPNIDRTLELISLKCLQKPVDLRYTSCQSLTDDLQAFLNNEPVSASHGRLQSIVSSWLRETHNAPLLQNWGSIWIFHSFALLAICSITNTMFLFEIENRWYYFDLWTIGLGTWALFFWNLRKKMGMVTFVERQIAHLWASSVIGCAILFPIEQLLGQPVLSLSPILGVINGMVFLAMAGILSGEFYLYAILMFLTSLLMALFPLYAHFFFGLAAASGFFFPGLKYHRQRLAAEKLSQKHHDNRIGSANL